MKIKNFLNIWFKIVLENVSLNPLMKNRYKCYQEKRDEKAKC